MIRPFKGITPAIASSCYVDASAQVIGDVVLAENASVWACAVLRGDVNSIRIGANSNIQDCAVLHGQTELFPVQLGDWVSVGHSAMLHGCTVEDRCIIGIGAIVLNGARIGAGSLVGAGALITEGKEFPEKSLIVGAPARVIRTLDDAAAAAIAAGADFYVRNFKRYAKGMKPVG